MMSKSHMMIWAEIKSLAEARGLKFKLKTESKFMKLLGVILWIINRRFMTHVTTTIGNTIYFPSQGWLDGADYDDRFNPEQKKQLGSERAWKVASHEMVHFDDGKKAGQVWFSLWYLFPLPLAVPALLAFWNVWFLLCLIALFPFPAPGRKYYEMRGYAATMAVQMWHENRVLAPPPKHVVQQFTSSSYYWMWPFKKKVTKELSIWIKKSRDLSITVEIPVLTDLRKIVGR